MTETFNEFKETNEYRIPTGFVGIDQETDGLCKNRIMIIQSDNIDISRLFGFNIGIFILLNNNKSHINVIGNNLFFNIGLFKNIFDEYCKLNLTSIDKIIDQKRNTIINEKINYVLNNSNFFSLDCVKKYKRKEANVIEKIMENNNSVKKIEDFDILNIIEVNSLKEYNNILKKNNLIYNNKMFNIICMKTNLIDNIDNIDNIVVVNMENEDMTTSQEIYNNIFQCNYRISYSRKSERLKKTYGLLVKNFMCLNFLNPVLEDEYILD